MVAMPAAWLGLGAWDNILYPSINRDDVARVMALDALNEVSEIKAKVAHRAVTSRAAVRFLFVLIVASEVTATLLLWAGAVSLAVAAFGAMEAETARMIATVGTLAFTSVWAAFLIGVQWFYYW